MTWPRIATAQDECIDAVSGAGWVMAMPSGHTARFEVSGGVGTLNFWGSLNYTDAAAALRVLSTAVTDYDVDPDDPRCRYIEYEVMINGKPGLAEVHVCDYGEPNRGNDRRIEIRSEGFKDAVGHIVGGGDIQLHRGDCK